MVFANSQIKNETRSSSLLSQFKILTNGRLLLAFLMTALGYGGTFVAFTYLSPILQKITGLSDSMINIVLVIYGIAIALGNLVGGKVANKQPLKALFWMFILQAIVLIIFTFTANDPVLGIITTFGGHPVCCAAGMAALNVLLEEKIIDSVEGKEQLFKSLLVHEKIKAVRSFGLWIAVEFGSFEINKK